MEVVLIQGNSNAGKTTLCKKVEKILRNFGFILDKDEYGKDLREVEDNPEKDFRAIYVHITCKTRIIIISGSDLITIIRRNRKFYNKYKKKGYDVLINAIRPENTIVNKHYVCK